MANILILGAGSMGTAFSFPCSDNKHSVYVVGTHLENKFINKINSRRLHPVLKCKVPKKVKFFKENKFNQIAKKKIDLLVIAVSSKGIEWASKKLSNLAHKNIPILILTKGLSINNNKYEVLAHKMSRLLKISGFKKPNISAIGGPCLAKGLVNRVHTSVVVANKNIKNAKKISKLISTNYYHVFTSTDLIGVEVCSAIKNIFALLMGAAEGICSSKLSKKIKKNHYLNSSAALLNQSINEMIIFTKKLNGKRETVMGLAGVGDLYVSDQGGRNSQMGKYLGQGIPFKRAKKIKMPNDTIEGADLIFEIGKKVKKEFNSKNLPLLTCIIDTVLYEKRLNINWRSFF